MSLQLPPVVDIAGIGFHPLAFEDAVVWILRQAEARVGGVVCTPNADYVVKSQRDRAFAESILSADIRVPDGMWVIYAARIAGRPLRQTVTGRLLLPAVAREAAKMGLPLALYGAGPGVAEGAREVLCAQFSGLQITAAISPPAGLEIGSAVDQKSVMRLRESGARIVFVALGAPKQELWMMRHRDALPGVVLVGVGAAFDIVSGRFRTAPRWMTKVGLEWAFRLAQEPRRLGRRYLVEDPWIVLWAVRERLRRRRG